MRRISTDATLNPERFKLPEEINHEIFQSRIVPEQLEHLKPSDTPTLTILMAQPGAGKTRVLDEVLRTKLFEQDGAFADIDSDIYKQYHPDYEALMKIDDKSMATCVGQDARLWMRQTYDYIRNNRINALTQEIVTNPEFLLSTLEQFKQTGFNINLTALAVPEAVSRQGILARYVTQVLSHGQGRLTEPGKTTQSITGMSEFVDQANSKNLLSNITIVKRDLSQWDYQPSDFNGLNISPTLEAIRNHPLSDGEIKNFTETQDWLEEKLDPTWREELAIVRTLASPLLKTCIKVA